VRFQAEVARRVVMRFLLYVYDLGWVLPVSVRAHLLVVDRPCLYPHGEL